MSEKPKNQSNSQSIIEVSESNQLQLQVFTNETFKKLTKRELKLTEMSLDDLKQYQQGLSLYKADLVAYRQVVEKEIGLREKYKNREPTTVQKLNSKYSGHQSVHEWGQYFFACLRQLLVEYTQSAKFSKSKPLGQSGYSELPSQDSDYLCPCQQANEFYHEETSTSSKVYYKKNE